VKSLLGPEKPAVPEGGAETAASRKAKLTEGLSTQNPVSLNVVAEEKITLNMSAQTDESDKGSYLGSILIRTILKLLILSYYL
jgi:hypothetical protein